MKYKIYSAIWSTDPLKPLYEAVWNDELRCDDQVSINEADHTASFLFSKDIEKLAMIDPIVYFREKAHFNIKGRR